MTSKSKKDLAGKLVRETLWDAIVPGRQLFTTGRLLRAKAEETGESVSHLKKLARDVRGAVSSGQDAGATAEMSFEEAISRRAPGALPIHELRRYFLLRKRAALGIGMVLVSFASLSVVTAGARADILALGVSLASVFASGFCAFAVALSAQLRIWQLDVRRLSRAERGGLQDFKHERPDWLWLTLSPEFGRRKAAERRN